jgi:hypothetical protein
MRKETEYTANLALAKVAKIPVNSYWWTPSITKRVRKPVVTLTFTERIVRKIGL